MTALTQSLAASLYGGAHRSVVRGFRVTAAAGDTLIFSSLHGLGACPFSILPVLRTQTAPAVSLQAAAMVGVLSWDASIATFAALAPTATQALDIALDIYFDRPYSPTA